MVSVNRLRTRRSDFHPTEWILDSGAFSELYRHGCHRLSATDYCNLIHRWSRCGSLVAAVTQDWMCEAFILERTGLDVREHQRRTIQGYDMVHGSIPVYLMPVLQGYHPREYVEHVAQYGPRLTHGMWVGVGSVCKRNASMAAIEDVLLSIKRVRPDLRLHGFGLKTTALESVSVCQHLHSADSMAWSFAARYEGRNGNDWREARRYLESLHIRPKQFSLDLKLP